MGDNVAAVATMASTIEGATISVKDISIFLAICVALVVITGFFLNRASTKRKEDQDEAERRLKAIMDAIKVSHDDSARDVRELTDKVKDGRGITEKEIEALKSAARHDRNNALTNSQAAADLLKATNSDIANLRDRMTTQEEKARNQDHAIGELKQLVREKFDETKDMIKLQGETSTIQFRELAASIREVRETKVK